MLNIFPYIFSTTFNTIANNMDVIDNIVDNVVNNIVNSDFMDNLVKNIDNMAPVEVQFKEHKRGYTIQVICLGLRKRILTWSMIIIILLYKLREICFIVITRI